MENHLGTDLIAPKKAPVSAKIAILIYWVISLLYLFFAVAGILTDKIIRNSIFAPAPNTPDNGVHSALIFLAAAWLAFAALKLFSTFKLSTRKNWARITVMIISALLGAGFIYLFIYMGFILHLLPFSVVLKSSYWPVAEIVAASLLLLPKSRGWFVPKRTSA